MGLDFSSEASTKNFAKLWRNLNHSHVNLQSLFKFNFSILFHVLKIRVKKNVWNLCGSKQAGRCHDPSLHPKNCFWPLESPDPFDFTTPKN